MSKPKIDARELVSVHFAEKGSEERMAAHFGVTVQEIRAELQRVKNDPRYYGRSEGMPSWMIRSNGLLRIGPRMAGIWQ